MVVPTRSVMATILAVVFQRRKIVAELERISAKVIFVSDRRAPKLRVFCMQGELGNRER